MRRPQRRPRRRPDFFDEGAPVALGMRSELMAPDMNEFVAQAANGRRSGATVAAGARGKAKVPFQIAAAKGPFWLPVNNLNAFKLSFWP